MITRDDITRYTGSDCADMAAALATLDPHWTRTFVQVDDEGWGHWMVRVGRDRYLDVEGVHTAADVKLRWDDPVAIREGADPEAWGVYGEPTSGVLGDAWRVVEAHGLVTEDRRENYVIALEYAQDREC